MIKIGAISEEDIQLIRELFFEDRTVFVSNTAKFEVDGDTLRCLSSMSIKPNCELNLVETELRILKIKEIATGIGYKFVDLRQEVNN
jgi:hypothetical protein